MSSSVNSGKSSRISAWDFPAASQGRYEDAISVLQRTTELAPNSVVVYQYLGQLLGNQGRFDPAIAAFEEAIKLDPSYAAAYYNLGFVLNAVDRTEEGKAAIQKALLLTREQTEQ